MIFEDSRYEKDSVVAVLGSDGAFHATVFHQNGSEGDIPLAGTHVVTFGETFATLAWQAFGDAELWWVLADANPHVYYPDEIPVGTVVNIPDVTAVQ